MSWLLENALALYGAVAGTAALAVSYFAYKHTVGMDSIKLGVSFAPHPNQAENLQLINDTEGKMPWEQIKLVKVYVVTIRNLGSIPAPLADAGVITDTGVRKHVLTGRNGDSILSSLADAHLEPLMPRSSIQLSVYLVRGESLFKASKAYVEDQTGKLWCSHA